MSVAETLCTLAGASLIMWGPIFGFAYATRRFGDSARDYIVACLGLCLLTVVGCVLLAIAGNAAS